MKVTGIVPAVFPWLDVKRYTFSLGLRAGARAILSGHSASEYDPEVSKVLVRGGMGDQARIAYAKIEAILDAEGLGFGDVSRLVEYIPAAAIEDYAEAEVARAEVFGSNQPAVSTVAVSRLLRPQALIEIEALAGAPGQPILADPSARPAFAAARASGEALFLSSVLPVAAGGVAVGEGDLMSQTRRVYETAGRILAAAGLGWDAVVKTVDYIASAALTDYKVTEQVRREHFRSLLPAASTVVMDSLAQPGVLIQVEFIASIGESEVVGDRTDDRVTPLRSQAVRAGDLLFISGLTARDPDTGEPIHAGDVVAQIETIYTNLLEFLRMAGIPAGNLVKTVEYVTTTGLDRYRETGAVRSRLLPPPYPASTGVVCAGLGTPGLEIEVDAMAVVG